MEITEKIEESVNTISGIRRVAYPFHGRNLQIFVTFLLEKDVDVAAQEVRDKVNRVFAGVADRYRASRPWRRWTRRNAGLDDRGLRRTALVKLTEYCDKVPAAATRVHQRRGPGDDRRGTGPTINVHLRPREASGARSDDRRSSGLWASRTSRSRWHHQKRHLRVHVAHPGTRDRRESPQRPHGGQPRRAYDHCGDLGAVEDGTEEIESYSFYNDTPAVFLDIRRQSGTNTVAVVDNLKKRLAELLKTCAKGYKIEVVRDQSLSSKAAVDTVKEHLLIGGILAAVVVYFFLANLRTTIIAALAIPTSIVSAFAVMYWFGFTLNGITLLALTSP